MTVNPNLVLIPVSEMRSQRNVTTFIHPYYGIGVTTDSLGAEMILIDTLELEKWQIVPIFSDLSVSFVDVEYRINDIVRFTERFLQGDLTPRLIDLLDLGEKIFLEKGDKIGYTCTAPNAPSTTDRSTFIQASWGTWQRSD